MLAKLSAALKGARKIEIFLVVIAIALCLMAFLGRGDESASTGLERRLERALSSISGAGNVTVMITESGGEVIGVLIVAEGANDMRVNIALAEAARKLLGVESRDIEIACGGG